MKEVIAVIAVFTPKHAKGHEYAHGQERELLQLLSSFFLFLFFSLFIRSVMPCRIFGVGRTSVPPIFSVWAE